MLVHSPFGEALPQHAKHVVIFRDPRNTLVSWVRFKNRNVTPEGFLMTELRAYGAGQGGLTFVQAYSEYLGYLTDPGTFTVRYEPLTTDGGFEMGRLADHLGVSLPADAYENLPGMTLSWSGAPSSWEDVWTPSVEDVWQETGGPALAAALGY